MFKISLLLRASLYAFFFGSTSSCFADCDATTEKLIKAIQSALSENEENGPREENDGELFPLAVEPIEQNQEEKLAAPVITTSDVKIIEIRGEDLEVLSSVDEDLSDAEIFEDDFYENITIEDVEYASPVEVQYAFPLNQNVIEEIELCPEVECAAPCLENYFEPCFIPYVFYEVGAVKFNSLPPFSYGMTLDPVTVMFSPSFYMTKKYDQPLSSYIYFGAGALLNREWLPWWVGQDLSFEIGAAFFNDVFRSTISAFSNISILPYVDGSAFLTTGAFPAGGTIKRRYRYKEIEGSISSSFPYRFFRWEIDVQPFVALCVDQFQQDYGLDLFDSETGQFALGLDENLYTTSYDLGGGASFVQYLPWYFNFTVNTGGYLAIARSSLSAHQQIVAGEGFAFVNFDTDKNVTSGKFKGSLSIGQEIGRFTWALIGRYEHWGYVARVKNFQTFTAPLLLQPVQIGNSSTSFYSLGLNASMEF